MKATIPFVLVASALSAILSAQIPERAQWEITFAQVEIAAGLSDLRTARPETYEARLMERAWAGAGRHSFLRLVRMDGTLRAQLFVFWAPQEFGAGQAPEGSDNTCRDGICVKPITLTEQRDWEEVVASLAHQNACPRRNPDGVDVVCAGCPQIWIKTAVDGRYREQSCPERGFETAADALLQLMKRATRAAGY